MRQLALVSLAVISLAAPARAEDGLLPKIDFPAVDTAAKPGEWVLAVNKLMYDRWVAKPDKENVIFYAHELIEAGPKVSKFKSPSGENVIPNSLIIPIKKGGKAKVGDIVLTWWQSGSGMKRAIVVDAKDPKQPVVRYLDIAYDNPAKSRDGKTTIGQMDEQLKPDSFVQLTKPFAPGSTVACKDGADHKTHHVVRVAGDKVLLLGFAGFISARAKADCVALPQKPKVKKGDKVRADFAGRMVPATVIKVDPKIGRVWVTYDVIKDKEYALPYGHVIAKL